MELGTNVPAQLDKAEKQLHLGAFLVRSDGGNWTTDPYSWTFTIQANAAGAGGAYLDRWGQTLGVPRFNGEADLAYAPRILAEITRPTTTNGGLERVIDDALGISGTRVLDGITPFKRFNSGRRFSGTKPTTKVRVFGLPATIGTASLGCCFLVSIPTTPATTQAEIERIIQRRKPAGTRLLAVGYAT